MMDLADFRLRLSVFYELKGIGVNVAHTKSEQRALKRSSRSATADDGSVIFGGNLSALVDEKSIEVDGLKVPKFLADIVEQLRKGLGTVGLFRIPGNSQRMKALRAELSCGKTIHGVPSDLASLLKAFFRELQEPLFTFGFFNGFIAAYKVADEELRKKAVLMLCCLLEEEHLHTLVLLMRLLQDVAKEPANQMDASSLASILTPNLLKPRDQAAVTSQMELANHASCVGVVEMLINCADEIGAVPMDVVKAAQDIKDEEAAKRTYLKLLSGRSLGWWSRRIRPRRNMRKQTNAVSVQTLNLLKKSERDASDRSPSLPRNRASTSSAGPVQYSQVLKASQAASPVAVAGVRANSPLAQSLDP
eukprot:TRINITY_DN12477_c1_g5_i3.p1 TRINITY_DN12477_c1_g5~~TRINITY_DN12477_c1_g5_i3.p1  ORF type:complete len:362 (+),score=84.34 TRINITY_DN12477_c1_g5_i3:285-1370(+)